MDFGVNMPESNLYFYNLPIIIVYDQNFMSKILLETIYKI